MGLLHSTLLKYYTLNQIKQLKCVLNVVIGLGTKIYNLEQVMTMFEEDEDTKFYGEEDGKEEDKDDEEE